jgi:hypothetical protein
LLYQVQISTCSYPTDLLMLRSVCDDLWE